MKAKAATPAQIAARKKFAERARSGELARMRKKNPVKTAQSGMRKKRVTKRDTQKADAAFEKKHGFSPKFIEQFGRLVQLYEKSGVSKEEAIKAAQNQVKAMTENLGKVKTNPTATRAPARKRTQLIQNGERKKNPIVKTFPAYGPFRFQVDVSKDGKTFRYPVGFERKIDAIKYAKELAEENPTFFVRVYELTAADLSYAV